MGLVNNVLILVHNKCCILINAPYWCKMLIIGKILGGGDEGVYENCIFQSIFS